MKTKNIITLTDKISNEIVATQIIDNGTENLIRFAGNFCYNGLRTQPAFQPTDYIIHVIGSVYDHINTKEPPTYGQFYNMPDEHEVSNLFFEFKQKYGIKE